jgi:exosortase
MSDRPPSASAVVGVAQNPPSPVNGTPTNPATVDESAGRADVPGVMLDAWLRGSRCWLSIGSVLLFGSLLAGLYWAIMPIWVEDVWDKPEYSHALFVPLFSAFVVWQRRRDIRAHTPRGTWWGLPVLLAGAGMLVAGEFAVESFLMRSSLLVILAGLVLFHLGPDIFWEFAFPLGFLFFMVPLPSIFLYAIAFPLQNLAAANAAWALDLLGVPVVLDGNIIQLSRLTLGVTEACSGVRSLVSLVGLAVAWAYVALPGAGAMVALALAALPITIVANAARVVATGLIGQWFGIEYAQGFFHFIGGAAIFAFAFAGLLAVHWMITMVRSKRA